MRSLIGVDQWHPTGNLIDDSTFSTTSQPTLTGGSVHNITTYFADQWRTVTDAALGETVLEFVTPDALHTYGFILAQAIAAASRPALAAGEQWTVSAWLLIPTGLSFQLGQRFQSLPNTGSRNISEAAAPSVSGTGAWGRYSFARIVPNDATVGSYLWLQGHFASPPPAGTALRVARPQIERGPLTDYTRTGPVR